MQDTDRIERALLKYLGEAETSPTESGDLEARAASMSRRISEVLTLKVYGARVVIAGGLAVVRVGLRSRRGGKRTVTAGMDAFAQLVGPALDEMPAKLVPGAVDALRAALGDVPEVIGESVSEAVSRLTSDPVAVGRCREELSRVRAKHVLAERENLVSKMLSLLVDGWTVAQLREAVDDACVRHVMTS